MLPGSVYFFKNVAMSVCCKLFRLRRKVSLAKGKSIYSDLKIIFPAPKISNTNLNFKLWSRKILLLEPRNYFLLAPTWIFLGIRYSQIFFWGIPLCFLPLGFTRLLLSWGTTSRIIRNGKKYGELSCLKCHEFLKT